MSEKIVATTRKARFEYFILESYEAGISLMGSEIKSVRAGQMSLGEAYVKIEDGKQAWLVGDAEFRRERVGEMPTEMFLHFFKSLSDAARMNLNIKAEGQNEHHKIEGIFKALARAIRMAVRRDIHHMQLPSSKGVL